MAYDPQSKGCSCSWPTVPSRQSRRQQLLWIHVTSLHPVCENDEDQTSLLREPPGTEIRASWRPYLSVVDVAELLRPDAGVGRQARHIWRRDRPPRPAPLDLTHLLQQRAHPEGGGRPRLRPRCLPQKLLHHLPPTPPQAAQGQRDWSEVCAIDVKTYHS